MKDRLENFLHAEVCAGRMPIEQAQREIASDWIAAYQKYLGEPTPAPCRPSAQADYETVTSRSRPVFTSRMKPRTGTSFAIQGCDLTVLICSFVWVSGSR